MEPRYIGAREANQQFSALLRQIEEQDITVVITRRGQPIVQMTRARPAGDAGAIAARMSALFEKFSRPMGFSGVERDALHDRDRAGET
jgi:antitoxin (DNA-binding transcriptional repressor) of toxin-antitoxin stability system